MVHNDFEAVLAAAQRGEEPAVAVLFRDLQPKLQRYLEARESRAADDLAGEVWLAVAQGIHRFEGGEEEFRAWAFSIARRRIADYRRTAVRRATEPHPIADLDAADPRDPESVVLADLSAASAAAFVVDQLPEDQAEVVLLRVVGGLTVDQVAAMLDIRPGTIRVMQHRALQRLRSEIVKAGVSR
jgi:RNA polymerase sigma-70 factor (ECF subfamily)